MSSRSSNKLSSTEYSLRSNSTAMRSMTPSEKREWRESAILNSKMDRALQRRREADRAQQRFMTLRKRVAKNAAKKGKAMLNRKSGATAAAKAKRELSKREAAFKAAKEAAELAASRFGTRSMFRKYMANATRRNKSK